MHGYLREFHERLRKRYAGSLVSVGAAKRVHSYAKQYLVKLAKEGLIEKVDWGWYFVPDKIEDIWDFLRSDRNLKVVAGQSAASFYNEDFIHRDVVVLKVSDRSYAHALEEYVKRRGWQVELEYFEGRITTRRIDGLLVEELEDTVMDCLQRWAFTDAFAALYSNRRQVNFKSLERNTQWKRISGTGVRMRQVLYYGLSRINELTGEKSFFEKQVRLSDDFIRSEVDDAAEKVVEVA